MFTRSGGKFYSLNPDQINIKTDCNYKWEFIKLVSRFIADLKYVHSICYKLRSSGIISEYSEVKVSQLC